MAAGLSERVWTLEEIVLMADGYQPKSGKRGPYKKKNRGIVSEAPSNQMFSPVHLIIILAIGYGVYRFCKWFWSSWRGE
jgi:hypothetical protein